MALYGFLLKLLILLVGVGEFSLVVAVCLNDGGIRYFFLELELDFCSRLLI